MIYILEDKSKDLSGLTSLFIACLKNQDVINTIKSSGTYSYDSKSYLWEVPITSLSYLLDNLYYFDDITLIVQENDENRHSETLKSEHRVNLYDYQKEGVEYFLNHDKGLLLDQPGLGKTAQMICLAEELKEQRGIEHCLVICGIASLRDNWKSEIAKHSKYDSVIIGERINQNNRRVWNSIPKRVEQLMNKIDEFFVIINVESIRYDEIVDAIKKGPNKYDLILVDECHKCKGGTSTQSINLLQITSKYQVGMTGTLLLNRPLDAFVPLAWIGVEKKSSRANATGISKFKDMYCVFDNSILSKKQKSQKYNKGRVVGYKNLDILKNEIDSCSIRRTKDILNLPPKNIINEYLTMDDSQLKFYDEIKNSVKEEYREMAKEDCDKIKLNTTNLLALTTRLRQATSCPSVLTSKDILSCKLERAVDLVDEITSNNDKVVIMCAYKESVYKLKSMLDEYKPFVGTGDVDDATITKEIEQFQTDDEHKVFICTISKMGTGLTLTRASYMIFIDLDWTSAITEQAQDRIYRIGSKKPVFIYNLICKDTIDELVLEANVTKKAFSDYLIDNKSDDFILSRLSKYLQDL